MGCSFENENIETMTINAASSSGLLRRLVERNLITAVAAENIHDESIRKKTPIVSLLVEKSILPALTIAEAAAEDFGIPLLDLNSFDTEAIPIELIDEKLMTRHHVLVLFRHGDRLHVAVSDPSSLSALNEFKFKTGLNTHPVLVEENKLSLFIDKVLTAQAGKALFNMDDASLEDIELGSEEESPAAATASDAEDAPVVRFVNKILIDAINGGVSDIHFEPFEKMYRIRYRRDGVLYEAAQPPLALAPRITARLKVVSQLDIAERRVPQDGHFKMALSKKRSLDFRINTCPTIAGEKVVIRILDPSSAHIGIEKLGYEEKQRQLFLDAIQRPQGMVLVTGPTGSGKTVSLYTALGILNTEEVNISTIEDPVEINVPGINQVNINLKAGLDFASALRAFLRQDPDIIMVGEIRDLETAEIAIKASQTGHMVLSTLHTNGTTETLTRLMNMGVPAFNVATSVNLIVAQRLARRLCPQCKILEDVPEKSLMQMGFTEAEIAAGIKIFGPLIAGCSQCHSGYTGRVGLYEVLPISSAIGHMIMEGGSSLDILEVALKEGLQTLRRSGLNRVRDGVTSLEELNRVTKD